MSTSVTTSGDGSSNVEVNVQVRINPQGGGAGGTSGGSSSGATPLPPDVVNKLTGLSGPVLGLFQIAGSDTPELWLGDKVGPTAAIKPLPFAGPASLADCAAQLLTIFKDDPQVVLLVGSGKKSRIENMKLDLARFETAYSGGGGGPIGSGGGTGPGHG